MKSLKISVMAFVASALLAGGAYAQSASKAKTFLDKGDVKAAEQEINAAAEAELAKLKAKGKPEQLSSKTLVIMGDVYRAMATDSTLSANEAMPYVDKALQAYEQVKKQEKEGSSVYKEVFESLPPMMEGMPAKRGKRDQLYDAFFNKGANAFNEQDYAVATDLLEMAFHVNPQDTLAGKYAFYAAASAENDPKTKAIIKKLFDIGYHDKQAYYTLLSLESKAAQKYEQDLQAADYRLRDAKSGVDRLQKELEQNQERAAYYSKGDGKRYAGAADKAKQAQKSVTELTAKIAEQNAAIKGIEAEIAAAQAGANQVYEKCLAIAKQGAEKNPEDAVMTGQVIGYYARLNRLDDAITSVNAALAKSPSDATLNYNLAVLMDQASDKAREAGDMAKSTDLYEKAAAQYDKVIGLNPALTDAVYNAGALHYNRGTVYNRLDQDLPRNAMGDAVDKAKSKEYHDKAVAHAKRALPYAQKANQASPKETKYLNLLLRIYVLTGDQAMADKIDQQLQALEGNN